MTSPNEAPDPESQQAASRFDQEFQEIVRFSSNGTDDVLMIHFELDRPTAFKFHSRAYGEWDSTSAYWRHAGLITTLDDPAFVLEGYRLTEAHTSCDSGILACRKGTMQTDGENYTTWGQLDAGRYYMFDALFGANRSQIDITLSTEVKVIIQRVMGSPSILRLEPFVVTNGESLAMAQLASEGARWIVTRTIGGYAADRVVFSHPEDNTSMPFIRDKDGHDCPGTECWTAGDLTTMWTPNLGHPADTLQVSVTASENATENTFALFGVIERPLWYDG
ncbi:MAG: hypothetical protein KY455_03375 [Euryarchaeota archaeon]|nr:hypothetical protein [Euryarchaeota archaeon]